MKNNYPLFLKLLFFVVVILFLPTNKSYCQTTLISPTGDGGFETGATFALNNWSVTAGTATQNQWVCNTGATAGFSGTSCAYITNNTAGTPPPHSYTLNKTRFSHLYRTVTVPAGQADIRFSFSWIGVGESGFDNLSVWIVPISYAPTFGTQIIASGTAPTGNVQVGATEYSVQSSWVNTGTITIPSAYAGTTFQLVFQWQNDNNGGSTPPAAIDNISLTSQVLVVPSNDTCANATLLPCATAALAGTTVGTVSEVTTGFGCAVSGYGVWYKFIGDGTISTISTTAGSGYDHEMDIMSGSCGVFTSISCNDAALSGGTESATFPTTIGTTYYVYIAHYSSSGTSADTGTFTISRTCVAPFNPCVSITNIASCGSNITATIASGNGVIDTSVCGYSTIGKEYIYTFTPSITGNYAIQQVSSTITYIDYAYKLISAGCGTTGWTCISDLTGSSLSTGFALTAGVQYYIMLDPESSTAGGTVVFNIVCPVAAPANDLCANAITLNCSSTLSGTTVGTTAKVNGTGCNLSSYGVWYKFVGDGTNNTITSVAGAGFDQEMAIVSGSCGSFVNLSCNDLSVSGGIETASFITTLGTTYYVYISYWNSSGTISDTGTFTISRSCGIVGTYCTASIKSTYSPSANYITTVSFLGALQDTSNTSTYSTVPRGYQDFTGLATKCIQADGQGVNVYIGTVSRGYYKAWIDWNNTGSFATVYDAGGVAQSSTTFGFVIPAGTTPGNYRIRIRMSSFGGTVGSTFGPCDANLAYYGETEDYLFTVVANCPAIITSVTDGVSCGTGNINLTATGSAGTTQYRWYAASTGGLPLASTSTGSWTTLPISTTTTYYVTAYNGTCESLVRTAIVAKVNPIPTVVFNPTTPTVCGISDVIQLTATGDKEVVYLVNENFESVGLGTLSNVNLLSNGATLDAKTMWQNRTSIFSPAQQSWFPAISSGFGANHFACATSDVGSVTTDNALMSGVVNTTNFINLTLNFRMYYSRYYVDGTFTSTTDTTNRDYLSVDVSTNGGGTWTSVSGVVTADIGIGTRFQQMSYNLGAYLNQTNMKIRVRYNAIWCDGVAIDDVQLFGERPLNTAFNYNTSLVNAYTNLSCTTPYTSGTPAATVYIKPTLLQLESASFNIPVTTTLTNGCVASSSITVTNNTKIYNSSPGTDWNTASNWKPAGVPTSSNCVVVVSNSTITGAGYQAFAKNLLVKSSGNLNVGTGDNKITVTDFVTVDPSGIFQLEDKASLVQINNVADTGNIIYKRNAQVKQYDYVYWSSPVAGYNVNNIYAPLSAGATYIWNPTTLNANSKWGDWLWAGGNTMNTAQGYILRAPSSYTSTTASTITGTFTGVPNNGNISIPISRGTNTGATVSLPNGSQYTNLDDNQNLIGNPYPSSIRASQFLFDNSSVLTGGVMLWSHGTIPSSAIGSPFYNTFQNNYTVADYIPFNFTGASCCPAMGSDVFIGAGQGFFVTMVDGAAATTNVNFNNNLRSSTYSNSLFYKSNDNDTDINDIERNRIWLDLSNNTTHENDRTLVGYIEGATNDADNLFDTQNEITDGITQVYSRVQDNLFTIQGKQLPFNQADTIPIGYHATAAGQHTIAIGAVDGLFENQNIYLHDLTSNVIYDIKQNPYTFTTDAGVYDNRFVLRFTDGTELNNTTFATSNEVKVITKDAIYIKSSAQNIKSVEVIDLLGRTLSNYENVNNKTLNVNNVIKNNATLILKIKLEDDSISNQKIIW